MQWSFPALPPSTLSEPALDYLASLRIHCNGGMTREAPPLKHPNRFSLAVSIAAYFATSEVLDKEEGLFARKVFPEHSRSVRSRTKNRSSEQT